MTIIAIVYVITLLLPYFSSFVPPTFHFCLSTMTLTCDISYSNVTDLPFHNEEEYFTRFDSKCESFKETVKKSLKNTLGKLVLSLHSVSGSLEDEIGNCLVEAETVTNW